MNNNESSTPNNWISHKENIFLLNIYWITCFLFGFGLFLPMMTLTKFLMLKNTISLASSISTLFSSGSWILFLVIFGFSVVMPLLKLRIIYILISAKGLVNKKTRKWLNLMHEYGRWGMLDVFVVSVLLVAVKLGVLAKVQIHLGLYCFGAAVLLMMLITHRLSKIYKSLDARQRAAS